MNNNINIDLIERPAGHLLVIQVLAQVSYLNLNKYISLT